MLLIAQLVYFWLLEKAKSKKKKKKKKMDQKMEESVEIDSIWCNGSKRRASLTSG